MGRKKKYIAYSDLMEELKLRGLAKINRRSIGHIVGNVSDQIAFATKPTSIYPSALVVHKLTHDTGYGFWTLDIGSSPPCKWSMVMNAAENWMSTKQPFSAKSGIYRVLWCSSSDQL